MHITSIVVLCLTICIDSFLICLLTKTNKTSDYIFIPSTFSLFQSFLFLIAFFIAEYIENFFQTYIKYIIFLIFCFMSLKMLIDTLINKKEEFEYCFTTKSTIISALLTSFDSLFLGFPLAFNTEKYLPLLIVTGLTTFIMCLLGLLLRKKVPNTLNDKISIIGSIVLFLFAIKSLL